LLLADNANSKEKLTYAGEFISQSFKSNDKEDAKMKFAMKLFAMLFFLVGTSWAAVNVNTATQSELEGVKGLGPSKAKAIIEYREKNGPFKSVDDLDKVKGFGKSSVEKLKGELSVDASAPDAAKTKK
jgi:competence protein ComEA